MGPFTRKAMAMAGSTVFHGALLAWGVIGYAPELDLDIEIEFTEVELLDPDQIQAQLPPAPPEPVVAPPAPVPTPTPEPATDEAKKDEPDKDETEEEPKDARDLGKRTTQVDKLGPTNSTFYMLLVPKKIRQLSYGNKALDVMAPLPDYQYLIAGGGLDALKDFDHLVIASSDIRDWTQTFLAVDYRMSREKMKAAIERAVANAGETIEWTEENGTLRGNPKPADDSEDDVDPRWFVLLDDHIAVYVREEFLPHVLGGEVAPGDAPTAGNYVANLAKLRKFASRQPTAGMQVVIKDLRAALKRVKGLPFQVPDRLEISVEATEEPELLVRADWPELVETKAFELWWKNDFAKMLSGKWKPVKWLVYDVVAIQRKQNTVELWARFETDQATMILDMISQQVSKFVTKTPQELAAQRRERLEKLHQREQARTPAPDPTAGEPAPKDETPTPPPSKSPAGPNGDADASPPQGASTGL